MARGFEMSTKSDHSKSRAVCSSARERRLTVHCYPMVNVRDIESGKVRATRDLFEAD
jgi:hypothetical protein